jgi:hypothetical protein
MRRRTTVAVVIAVLALLGGWPHPVSIQAETSVAGGPAASVAQATPKADPATQTVYVTKTGKKYHRAGCQYLAHSSIAMSLKDAAARYTPCSVCRPPTLSSGNTAAKSSTAPAKAPAGATAQCRDGSYSFSASRRGTCSHHGGVARWLQGA